MKWLFLFIQEFGFWNGLRSFIIIRLKLNTRIRIPGIKNDIYLRPGTTDKDTFIHTFIFHDYNLDLKTIPKTIVDIGANIGLTTLYWLRKYPNARFICLEPESGNFSAMQKNLHGYQNVKTFQLALWSKKTKIEIIDTGEGEWSFQVRESNTANGIDAINLNDLLELNEEDTIDFLKIDIEGSELQVFNSISPDFFQNINVLVVETHDRNRPGCTSAVMKCMLKNEHLCYPKADNFVFYKEDFK